ARATEALNQPGPREGPELLLQESEGDLLTLGDLPSRDERSLVLPLGKLDHRAHRVFQLLGDLEHERTSEVRLGTAFAHVNAGPRREKGAHPPRPGNFKTSERDYTFAPSHLFVLEMSGMADRHTRWNDARTTMVEDPSSFEDFFHAERDRL